MKLGENRRVIAIKTLEKDRDTGVELGGQSENSREEIHKVLTCDIVGRNDEQNDCLHDT